MLKINDYNNNDNDNNDNNKTKTWSAKIVCLSQHKSYFKLCTFVLVSLTEISQNHYYHKADILWISRTMKTSCLMYFARWDHF